MRTAACLLASMILAALGARAEEEASATGEGGIVPAVDRVKSVQKKPFLKDGRVEVTPSFQASVNDAFFQKLGGGVTLAYHLADALALRASYARFGTVRTDNVRIAKRELHSRMYSANLLHLAGAGLAWTPVYGKLALFGERIVHFDLFLSLGFGAAFTDSVDGWHPAASGGGGARLFIGQWLAAELSLIDQLYREEFTTVSGDRLSDVQSVLLAGIGFSVFFPFEDREGP